MSHHTKELAVPRKEKNRYGWRNKREKTIITEAGTNIHSKTRAIIYRIQQEFESTNVEKWKKRQGTVHQIQGIYNHPRTWKLKTPSRNCDVDQHRINSYHTVTYVNKGHDRICFHQRRYVNYRGKIISDQSIDQWLEGMWKNKKNCNIMLFGYTE